MWTNSSYWKWFRGGRSLTLQELWSGTKNSSTPLPTGSRRRRSMFLAVCCVPRAASPSSGICVTSNKVLGHRHSWMTTSCTSTQRPQKRPGTSFSMIKARTDGFPRFFSSKYATSFMVMLVGLSHRVCGSLGRRNLRSRRLRRVLQSATTLDAIIDSEHRGPAGGLQESDPEQQQHLKPVHPVPVPRHWLLHARSGHHLHDACLRSSGSVWCGVFEDALVQRDTRPHLHRHMLPH